MARPGAVKAGEAYVELFSDDTPLVRGMKGLGAKLSRTGERIGSIGKSAAAAGAGIKALGAAVVGPLAAATRSFQTAGDEIQKLGIRTNASAAFLSELGFAAEQSGTNLDSVGAALFRMNRRVANATTEMGPAQRAIELLGLSAQQLNRLSTEDRFLVLADALSKMKNETLAAQLGFEIFGDNFRQIKPLIDEGAGGIRALTAEAKELGITIGQEDADAAAKLGDAMNRVGRSVQASFLKLGAAVAPTITKIADTIAGISAGVAKWIDQNRELVTVVAAVGTGLAAVGTAVAVVGGGVAGLGLAISGLHTALGAVAAVVGTISAPVAAVAAGVVALGAGVAYVAHQAGLLGPAFEFVRESFGRVFATFQKTFGGIVSALKGGQFKLAAQIAWAGVKVATLQGAQQVLIGVEYLWDNAGKITTSFFSALGKLVYKAFASIPKIALAALRGGAALAEAMQSVFAGVFTEANLAATLEPALARAQRQLNARLQQASRLGQRRAPADNRRPPPDRIPPNVRRPIGPPAELQQPPQAVPGPAQAQAQAVGGNADTQFGQLLALTRRQVQLLGQIAAQGGLG